MGKNRYSSTGWREAQVQLVQPCGLSREGDPEKLLD